MIYTYSTDVLVLAYYYENYGKAPTHEKLEDAADNYEATFETELEDACAAEGVPFNKTSKSMVLMMTIMTRGDSRKERARKAARAFRKVLDEGVM
ncbi:MAG: hypothetical protein LC804_26455 [Acidobacteria bacterium]|nr:hypothetical protein [Acidobacteriota bacterium]